MITKNCAKCGQVFEYIPVVGYPDKRKYCDNCKAINDAEYLARQKQPVEQNGPVNAPVQKIPATGNELVPETGTFQSTVWTHVVAANSYEVGKVGDRFKLYFETPEELQAKIAELKRMGFMKDEFKPLEPQGF